MNNEYILSVSVAAYNVEKYIEETLQSFTEDYFKNKVEVLIITDGATDNTDNIAQKYVDLYPEIFKLIKKENGGWGSTLNVGMNIAKGKYFKQLDGDDYFDKENLKEFVDFLENCDEDLIISPFVTFDDETREILEGKHFKDINNELLFPTTIDKLIEDYSQIYMHAFCVKTKVLVENQITIEEKCFYTDEEFVMKTIMCVKDVNLFTKSIYMYRFGRSGQSVSISGYEKHYKDRQKVLFKLIDVYTKYSGNIKLKEFISNKLLGMVISHYDIYLMISKSKQHKKDFMEFDSLLKTTSKYFYEKTKHVKKIALLRYTNFATYGVVRTIKKIKDK